MSKKPADHDERALAHFFNAVAERNEPWLTALTRCDMLRTVLYRESPLADRAVGLACAYATGRNSLEQIQKASELALVLSKLLQKDPLP